MSVGSVKYRSVATAMRRKLAQDRHKDIGKTCKK